MSIWPLPLPWLELAIVVALLGALWVSQLRNPLTAWTWGLFFTGASFVCTILACWGFYVCRMYELDDSWSLESYFFGRHFLDIDELNAPLLPVLALIHFLTALATGRTKMRRFSLSWSLTSVAGRLAIFGCSQPWALLALLGLFVVPPYIELRNRGKPTRVYVIHMGMFVALLALGGVLAALQGTEPRQSAWASVALMAALLIRCGAVPVHCWLTDWFEHASFGNALLFVTPLTGVYACVRLVLPVAPEWVLQGIGLFSLITAVYAAGMAVVQQETRRFFAYLFLSHASLVLVGLELHTSISLTGALALWISVMLSLCGFGLTLRALEARFGRLTLGSFYGLYNASPALAVCFLLTGLASVGFPGTLGFVATELLVDGAVEASPSIGLVVVVAGALNGIAVVRAYLYLFTGAHHVSTVSLEIGPRERFAVATLAILILGGGIAPQLGVHSRYEAATMILQERQEIAANANADGTRTIVLGSESGDRSQETGGQE